MYLFLFSQFLIYKKDLQVMLRIRQALLGAGLYMAVVLLSIGFGAGAVRAQEETAGSLVL